MGKQFNITEEQKMEVNAIINSIGLESYMASRMASMLTLYSAINEYLKTGSLAEADEICRLANQNAAIMEEIKYLVCDDED